MKGLVFTMFITIKKMSDCKGIDKNAVLGMKLGHDENKEPAVKVYTASDVYVFPITKGFQVYNCNEFLRYVSDGLVPDDYIRFDTYSSYAQRIDNIMDYLKAVRLCNQVGIDIEKHDVWMCQPYEAVLKKHGKEAVDGSNMKLFKKAFTAQLKRYR